MGYQGLLLQQYKQCYLQACPNLDIVETRPKSYQVNGNPHTLRQESGRQVLKPRNFLNQNETLLFD